MAGDQPDERLVDWLDGIDHLPSGADGVGQATASPEDQSRVRSGAENRGSLDDILQAEVGEIPEALDLPESHASSTVNGHDVDRNAPQNSLEDILQTGTPVIPSAVPLSQLGNSTTRTRQDELPSRIEVSTHRGDRRRTRHTYNKTLENASKVLDHIKNGNVRKEPRHNRTSIVYYDYTDNARSNPTEIRDAQYIASLGRPPQDVRQRLLVVEDLSKPTINALGETFGINPEFFEEHLLNSGYAGGEYDMLPARTWPTASLKKSYVSMRWMRPVYRLPMYTSNRSMKDLADASTAKTQNSDDEGEKPPGNGIENFTRRGVVTTRVSTNIFRSEWALWTDPEKTGSMPRECGLEERVSVWNTKVQRGNCDLVIILFDPLPVVEETHPETYIEESASSVSSPDTDSVERGPDSPLFEEEVPLIMDQPLLMVWINKYLERKSRRPARGKALGGDSEVQAKQTFQKVIVKQIAPRHPLAINLDKVFQKQESTAEFERKLGSPTSTAEDTRNQLEHQSGPVNLARIFIQIIRQDTLALLRLLDQVLDGVEFGILDDNKMEDRLFLWRQIISRAQRELPELRASIEPFIASINPSHPPSTAGDNLGIAPDVMQEIRELSKEITQMCTRLQQVSALLTSNMGLLDSRRSIDEAHAVSRLTELAFVFVPLSFATSIFGMQIVPFADPVPVQIFIGVAIGVTSFAYLMRITMRSQWFSYFKRVTRHDIQKYADSHGFAVPTRSMPMLLTLQWIGACLVRGWKRMWKSIGKIGKRTWRLFGFTIVFIFVNGIAVGVPTAALWARDLDPATQGAITIATVMIVFFCVTVPLCRYSEPSFRDALPKLIIGGIYRVRKLLVFVLPILTTAIALAMIWTRPLAAGIKAGLTVGFLTLVGLTIVTFLFRLQFYYTHYFF